VLNAEYFDFEFEIPKSEFRNPHLGVGWFLFTIKTKKRDSLQTFLKKRGIETLIHYPIPIPFQKAYQELGYRRKGPSLDKPVVSEDSLPSFFSGDEGIRDGGSGTANQGFF
jgi:dTDP-4-amino-4,6-dideoxygalactose transaminase